MKHLICALAILSAFASCNSAGSKVEERIGTITVNGLGESMSSVPLSDSPATSNTLMKLYVGDKVKVLRDNDYLSKAHELYNTTLIYVQPLRDTSKKGWVIKAFVDF